MKRTFGRFMSLLLVLAMVLAMVPAALAAYEVYSVAPGAKIDLSSAATTASGVSALTWTCSDKNGTYLTVAAGNTGHATVTGVRASSSYFTVTATGKKGGYQTTIDTFTVYVQDAYTLTLTQSDPNNASNTSTSLYEGDTRTLTAKVTVSNNAQEWNQDKIQVVFESDTAHASVTNSTVALTAVKNSSGYVTSYAATTTLKAVDAGYARVTAKVQYQKSDENWYDSASTYAKDKYILFNISGKTAIKVNLPTNQTNYDLIVGGTNPTTGTLTPTVTGVTGTNARLKYLYDSTNMYVDVDSTTTRATIHPVKTCAATKIYICLADYNTGLIYENIDQSNPSASIMGSYAVCTVAIRSPAMSVTKLEVVNSNQEQQKRLDNGTLVFGLQDSNYNYGKNGENIKCSGLILDALSLTACIKAPASLLASAEELASAYSRIKWESSNTSVVKVTDTTATDTSATAVLKPVSAGFATITAIAGNNVTAIYKVEVYQGRAYQIKEYPGLDENVTKMTDAELKRLFEKKTAKVEIQTSIYADETAIYELPVKNVSASIDDTGAAVTYQINGLKTATREFFYDRDDKAGDKVYTEKKEFIAAEPAIVSVMTASGKIGEQVEVELRLSKNPGFADLSLEIGYDSKVMELTEIRPNTAVGGTFIQGQSLETLPFMIGWVEAENNITFTGTLATLVFTIKKDAPTGKYPITVDFYHGLQGDYIDGIDVNFNMDDKRVPITYANGSVIVCTYKPGDINGDEKVSLEDAIKLLQYIAGWKLDNLVNEALDVNADGRINSKDVIRILRYIAGWDVILY